jgi:hypothetical protein
MKPPRIWGTFPWRMVMLLALALSLPSLAFWAWLAWELPPLERYYLVANWDSSKHAREPEAQTRIQWLHETAPGRKTRFLIGSSVTKGNQNALPMELSSVDLKEGWFGIEKGPLVSMPSVDLERFLRDDFYDGQSFHELIAQPLLYCCAACVVVLYLGFVMRVELAGEWSRLYRVSSEPEWATDLSEDWPVNLQGIAAWMRARIVQWIRRAKVTYHYLNFAAGSDPAYRPLQRSNTPSSHADQAPLPIEIQRGTLRSQSVANQPPSNSAELALRGHRIFPGSSSSNTRLSQPKPWDESEWID